LPIITFGTVGILGSEPTLSFSLSPEEDEDKAEEIEILLEECLAMR